MLNEWSRAMVSRPIFPRVQPITDNLLKTDGEVSRFNPPNTAAFDPQMRRRSLFQRPPNSTTAVTMSETTPPLAQASELLREVRKLFGPTSSSRRLSSEAPTSPTFQQVPASPPTNTPSKLRRYLEYAEKHLGVNDATLYEHRLAQQSFGPDILPVISEQLLVDCGLTMGDAVRLKRGASSWWMSPEAKRPKLLDQPPPQANLFEPTYQIRFEKRFVEGGSHSVFGSGLVPGKNIRHRPFTWYFYNEATKTVERVPDGFVPTLDPIYLDMDESPYDPTPTPSPEPTNVNEAGEEAGGS